MRKFGYITPRYGKYYLYVRGEYKGSYDTWEEAEQCRDSLKETYTPVEISCYLPLFPERLNQAIGNRNVSQLCKQARINRSNISNYLNGQVPSVKNLMSLALALNVSTDWLLGLKG
jgi:transcriptional regulator with XRE-family HTH domain